MDWIWTFPSCQLTKEPQRRALVDGGQKGRKEFLRSSLSVSQNMADISLISMRLNAIFNWKRDWRDNTK
jgi:hypothetical protein